MAHHEAWEGGSEHQVEEAATTIFQKIVRLVLWYQQIQTNVQCLQEVPGETAKKELGLFWAGAQGVGEINKVDQKNIGRKSMIWYGLGTEKSQW